MKMLQPVHSSQLFHLLRHRKATTPKPNRYHLLGNDIGKSHILKFVLDSAAQFGMLFSVYGMALAIFPLLLGRLSETLLKKPLIVIGSLLFSVQKMLSADVVCKYEVDTAHDLLHQSRP